MRATARILDGDDEHLGLYPGHAAWWGTPERCWNSNRSSARLSLVGRLDFRRGLSQQFAAPEHRIVYSASGMYLAAAVLSDPDHRGAQPLYCGTATSLEEARYLSRCSTPRR
jgi:hypothetical protein